MIEKEMIHGVEYPMRSVKGKRMYKPFIETENAVHLLSSKKDIILFDLETTGTNIKTDYVAEISMQRFRFKDNRYQKDGSLDFFVKPPVPMPDAASAVNHITNEFLADKPSMSEVFPKINAFVGNPENVIFMGYNSRSFDIPILKRIYQMELGITLEASENIDVFLMAKELVKPEECPDQRITLSNVCSVFDLTSEHFHNSSEDVEMTGRLFAKLLAIYPLHRPFYFVQNDLPNLNITWSKRIKANYKTQGTSAYIIIGVDGFYEDGTRVSGNVYYDVTKRRIIDNSDSHEAFIGHFNMNDLFSKIESLVNSKKV